MIKPKDEFSSGNNDAVCWAKLYAVSDGEMDNKIRKYMRQYPTEGYGTHIASKTTRDGVIHVQLRRYHSCD